MKKQWFYVFAVIATLFYVIVLGIPIPTRMSGHGVSVGYWRHLLPNLTCGLCNEQQLEVTYRYKKKLCNLLVTQSKSNPGLSRDILLGLEDNACYDAVIERNCTDDQAIESAYTICADQNIYLNTNPL